MTVRTKSTQIYEENRVLFIFDVLQFSADLLIAIPPTLRQPSRCLQCVFIFTPSYLSLSGAFTKLRNTIRIFMSVCRYVLPSDRAQQFSFITTMRLPILQLSCRIFVAKHHITQVCQPPYRPHLAPCDFWLFPKLKSPLNGRRFVTVTVT